MGSKIRGSAHPSEPPVWVGRSPRNLWRTKRSEVSWGHPEVHTHVGGNLDRRIELLMVFYAKVGGNLANCVGLVILPANQKLIFTKVSCVGWREFGLSHCTSEKSILLLSLAG